VTHYSQVPFPYLQLVACLGIKCLCLVQGVLCPRSNIWCLAFGVWRLATVPGDQPALDIRHVCETKVRQSISPRFSKAENRRQGPCPPQPSLVSSRSERCAVENPEHGEKVEDAQSKAGHELTRRGTADDRNPMLPTVPYQLEESLPVGSWRTPVIVPRLDRRKDEFLGKCQVQPPQGGPDSHQA